MSAPQCSKKARKTELARGMPERCENPPFGKSKLCKDHQLVRWQPVLARAIEIMKSLDLEPSLRQVYYRLMGERLIPSTKSAYTVFSRTSAKGRREGWFPSFSEGGRRIMRPNAWDSPSQALRGLVDQYRLDRTRGQEQQVWVILEKDTLEALAISATWDYGIPVAAMRGYGSLTIAEKIARAMLRDGRPVRIFYIGDYDASGKKIETNFLKALDLDVPTPERLAVTLDQIRDMRLVKLPGKPDDVNNAEFRREHDGELFQVEVEAIEPNDLVALIREAVEATVDYTTWQAVVDEEAEHRAALRAMADAFEDAS